MCLGIYKKIKKNETTPHGFKKLCYVWSSYDNHLNQCYLSNIKYQQVKDALKQYSKIFKMFFFAETPFSQKHSTYRSLKNSTLDGPYDYLPRLNFIGNVVFTFGLSVRCSSTLMKYFMYKIIAIFQNFFYYFQKSKPRKQHLRSVYSILVDHDIPDSV